MRSRLVRWLPVAFHMAGWALASSWGEEVRFHWISTGPLIGPGGGDGSHAIKDPTIVRHGGRWHVYATIKRENTTIMEYLGFEDWRGAQAASRVVLGTNETYRCAPQLFRFSGDGRWYLLHQWTDSSRQPPFFGPALSTLAGPDRPETLGPALMLFDAKPPNVPRWIDFWIIGDGGHVYLFFTGDDGRFWRSRTASGDFPRGWSAPELVLQQGRDAFFEAAHVYRLKGQDRFLNVVEAIGPGQKRYYKAFVAGSLDGEWRPLAASWENPFASIGNISFGSGAVPWTDCVSHGELLREGDDERMIVDFARLRFLYQGCTADQRAGRGYGAIPWRLGLLSPAP